MQMYWAATIAQLSCRSFRGGRTMLYVSERNYGCRFKEVYWHDVRTVILENEKISATILVDKGTDIISLNYKPMDLELLWSASTGLSLLKKRAYTQFDEDFIDNGYIGGWFECFPNAGPDTLYNGQHFKGNAEVTYLPWEYSVEQDDEKEVTLKFFVRLTKLPLMLTKYITVKSGEAKLFIREEAVNLSAEPCGYLWGHHPNVGGRFLDESVRIDFPNVNIKPLDFVEGPRAKKGYWETWPTAVVDGITYDYRSYPKKGEPGGALLYMANFEHAWGAIRNQNRSIGIGYSWDKEAFPNAILWVANQKGTEDGAVGGKDLVTIFPKSGDVNALGASEAAGELRIIPPREKITSWFTATVFSCDEKPVQMIDKNGEVSF